MRDKTNPQTPKKARPTSARRPSTPARNKVDENQDRQVMITKANAKLRAKLRAKGSYAPSPARTMHDKTNTWTPGKGKPTIARRSNTPADKKTYLDQNRRAMIAKANTTLHAEPDDTPGQGKTIVWRDRTRPTLRQRFLRRRPHLATSRLTKHSQFPQQTHNDPLSKMLSCFLKDTYQKQTPRTHGRFKRQTAQTLADTKTHTRFMFPSPEGYLNNKEWRAQQRERRQHELYTFSEIINTFNQTNGQLADCTTSVHSKQIKKQAKAKAKAMRRRAARKLQIAKQRNQTSSRPTGPIKDAPTVSVGCTSFGKW